MEMYVYIIFLSLTLVGGQSIIKGPTNTAGVIGERIGLACEVNSGDDDMLEWRFFPPGEKESTGNRIWMSEGGLVDETYEVEIVENLNTLVIRSLQEESAGLYVCHLLISGEERFAKVSTLNEFACDPSGEVSADSLPAETKEDDVMVFRCSVEVTGDLIPTLQWFDNAGNEVPTVQNQDPDSNIVRGTAEITATPDLDETGFECRLSFDYARLRSYPPEYSDQCQSLYRVQYAPRDIVITGMVSTGMVSVDVGSFIDCSARGRPPPLIFWLNEDTGDLRPEGETQLEITPELEGQQTWLCTARNYIRGVENTAEKSITFSTTGFQPPAKSNPDTDQEVKVQAVKTEDDEEPSDTTEMPEKKGMTPLGKLGLSMAILIPFGLIFAAIGHGLYHAKQKEKKEKAAMMINGHRDSEDRLPHDEPLMYK